MVVEQPDHIVEMTLFNISETTRCSNLKIRHNVALNNSHIVTGNDVTIHFRSAAKCINVFILVIFGTRFLDNNSVDFEKGLPFWKGDSSTCLLWKPLEIFAP